MKRTTASQLQTTFYINDGICTTYWSYYTADIYTKFSLQSLKTEIVHPYHVVSPANRHFQYLSELLLLFFSQQITSLPYLLALLFTVSLTFSVAQY